MKRLLRTLVVATAAATLPASAGAQEVGVKFGGSYATMAPGPAPAERQTSQDGNAAGMWFRTPAWRRISFQIDALYTQKGRWMMDNSVFEHTTDIRIKYIELPVVVRTDFPLSNPKMRLHVVVGGAPAFKRSGRVTRDIRVDLRRARETLDISERVENFDLGVVAGAGFEYSRLLLELRYIYGTRPVMSSEDGLSSGPTVKNRAVTMMMGLRVF